MSHRESSCLGPFLLGWAAGLSTLSSLPATSQTLMVREKKSFNGRLQRLGATRIPPIPSRGRSPPTRPHRPLLMTVDTARSVFLGLPRVWQRPSDPALCPLRPSPASSCRARRLPPRLPHCPLHPASSCRPSFPYPGQPRPPYRSSPQASSHVYPTNCSSES